MTRIGINPARGKTTDAKPQRITVALVTYLPDLSGYFEHRLEVLKLVIDSLSAHTSLPHDVMVFDNASCLPVIDYLQQCRQAGQINFLLLSDRNIGKIDALRVLFEAAPGEFIAYADDDILFYPGWLEAHLRLLESFPQAGMVSGVAVRSAAGHAHASLDRLAAAPPAGVSARRERRIPDAWERDWALSTGRDAQAHLDQTREQLDLVLTADTPGGAVEAIAGANHFQFVARKAQILPALPAGWTGRLMGSMIELDEAVDRLGLLRLSTAGRFTRHLGNALSPELVREAQALGLAARAAPTGPRPAGPRRRPLILRIPGSRRVLVALYNKLFKILF
ncbi:MAG: glycosyltransferase family A protein [Chloroflexota bacterium]